MPEGDLCRLVREGLKRGGIDLGESAFATDDDVYKFYTKVMAIGPTIESDESDDEDNPKYKEYSRRPPPKWKRKLLARQEDSKYNVEQNRKIVEGWQALKKSIFGNRLDFKDLFSNEQKAFDIVNEYKDDVKGSNGLAEEQLLRLQTNIHDALHRMQLYFISTIITIVTAFFFFQMNTGVSPVAAYQKLMGNGGDYWQGPGYYTPNPVNKTEFDRIQRQYYSDQLKYDDEDNIKKFPYQTPEEYNRAHSKFYSERQSGDMLFTGQGGYAEDGTYVQKAASVNVDGYTFE